MTKFLAVPPYTPGHDFSGRKRELHQIELWAASPEQPILILEAIGGMGKSMLSWHWVNREVSRATTPFAGFFWYSFYERGADMADFCAHALAFLSGNPLSKYREQKTAHLAIELVSLLRQRPWLLVLDGLERVLVAYNRHDAAQIRDEQVSLSGDSIKSTALDCIRPSDSALLKALMQSSPSKVLISSRLMPSALADDKGFSLSGVSHHLLNGLAPEDAEAMLRAVLVSGDSLRMRQYLERQFGCHPLMVGVVGGLVKNFASAPGDFDRWEMTQPKDGIPAPEAMDLVKSRNHLLKAAFDDLNADAHTLLARIGLVSESVDEETMVELNPRRPDPPFEVEPPDEWQLDVPELVADYHREKSSYETYLLELDRWRNSPALAEAETFLRETIKDLSSRGLLQCDHASGKYDLHPVVRSYAVSSISPEQLDDVGQRVVDHFSSRMDVRSRDAKTIHDLRNGLQVARTLLQLGRIEQAAYSVNYLEGALFWSLEAWDIYLALARPLFSAGWLQPPHEIDRWQLQSILNGVALALNELGDPKSAITVGELALELAMEIDSFVGVIRGLRNLALYNGNASKLGNAFRLRDLEAKASLILADPDYLALYHLDRSIELRMIGDLQGALEHWVQFDTFPRPENRGIYRPGYGEYRLADLTLDEGALDEAFLLKIHQIATEANSRWVIRALHWLRGEWKLSLGLWQEAAGEFEEHIRMTREANLDASWSEARLELAHLKLRHRRGTLEAAERISTVEDPPHAALAELYLALGETEKARKSAQAGYAEAWGDGMPYVNFRTLQQCKRVFQSLGDPEPQLNPFDSSGVKPFAFENKLAAYLAEKSNENLVN